MSTVSVPALNMRRIRATVVELLPLATAQNPQQCSLAGEFFLFIIIITADSVIIISAWK